MGRRGHRPQTPRPQWPRWQGPAGSPEGGHGGSEQPKDLERLSLLEGVPVAPGPLCEAWLLVQPRPVLAVSPLPTVPHNAAQSSS